MLPSEKVDTCKPKEAIEPLKTYGKIRKMTESEVTKLIIKGVALASTGKHKEAIKCFDNGLHP